MSARLGPDSSKISFLALTSCSSKAKKEIFDESGPSLADIYANPGAVQDNVGFSDGNLDSYTRTADAELDVLFPELPNPRLVMYIFPHLSDEGAPIPGYSTSFYLYEHSRVFALPGEVGVSHAGVVQ